MKERSFDEMIAYFNRRVSEMDIAQDYKMELLGMVTALGYKHEKTAQPERKKKKRIIEVITMMSGEMCKTCIHTKVCRHDKNLVGDVYVAPHPMFGHEYAVKAWNAYLERKEKLFPCDDYLASADVIYVKELCEICRCEDCTGCSYAERREE